MKLEKIKIVGFKSINEVEFPIVKYGKTESYTTILLGKNETGKSNILDAMATPLLARNQQQVDFLKIRNMQTEPELVSVFFTFNLRNDTNYRTYISDAITLPEELLNNITINCFTKEYRLQKKNTVFSVDYDFSLNNISLTKYFYTSVTKTVTSNTSANSAQTQKKIETTVIKHKSELDEQDENPYTPLDADQLKSILKKALDKFAETVYIPVDVWKANSDYLIQDNILLDEFAENPSNLPLKNMFFLANIRTKDEIRVKIDEIKEDHKQRRKLQTLLSKQTTQYLNTRWKELEISIVVEINDNLVLNVFVQDKRDKENFFDMSDRSQGFKQFVSLLLSISISSLSGAVKDHLILIDEPEIHLHPSGARWMLQELLEIGKNNFLFMTTHSNFMLDKETRDRHFLITKDRQNLTNYRQIKNEEDINDDEVLKSAFGINTIFDFLSPYKILVEGASDKELLSKALVKRKKNHSILISNGNGNNLPAVASIMSLENVNPLVITDDDKAGRAIKESVKTINDDFKQNTFTIKDLNTEIIDGGTIEDTLPKDFIEKRINQILEENAIQPIQLNDYSPFCTQLTIHLNKQISENNSKLNKKAEIDKISKNVKNSISNYDANAISQSKSPKLYDLAEKILEYFKI
jgi:predicted ATP-dependent endonuclease of OLD family